MSQQALKPDELPGLVQALRRRITAMDETIEQMQEQIDQQQYVIDRLVTDLPTQTLSKQDKIGRIIDRALSDAGEDATIAYINQDTAAGVADCTKRHARNLFQDIEASYDWATYNPDRDPAGLECDFGDTPVHRVRESLSTTFPTMEENDG